ncbi:hypothetical protein HA402_007730 [Bradysia odoriphaga]|nr:hypothetical protein HA402_007730 [Bradysia odoriphaga]
MATKEHLILSAEIKRVHKDLRKRTKKYGSTNAWKEHINNKNQLDSYSKAMRELATKFWDSNLKVNEMTRENRIEWSVQFCLNYFHDNKIRNHNREREKRIFELLPDPVHVELSSRSDDDCENQKIRLLDVGSCYNPFKQYDSFTVTAIDISPACPDVHRCDFLNVPVIQPEFVQSNSITDFTLTPCSYDVVVFSLLLEYLPTSEQRLICCKKAYDILDTEGILIVITPDSKHVGANAKFMKNWRYTLALMGFSRIKYEKLVHITCMVFRKALFKDVTVRWADIHKEDYMTNDLFIPQDFNDFEAMSSDSES